MRLSARIVVFGSSVPLVLGAAGIALAQWNVGSTGGDTTVSAAEMPPGSAPKVVVGGPNGSAISVSWPVSKVANEAVDGYEVLRYDATGVASHPGGTCAGVVAGLGCAESAIPAGIWTYTVRPRQGAKWVGKESPRSLPVTVAASGVAQLGQADNGQVGSGQASSSPSVSQAAQPTLSASASASASQSQVDGQVPGGDQGAASPVPSKSPVTPAEPEPSASAA